MDEIEKLRKIILESMIGRDYWWIDDYRYVIHNEIFERLDIKQNDNDKRIIDLIIEQEKKKHYPFIKVL